MACTDKKLKLIFGDVNLGVRGEGFTYIFSYAKGGPLSLRAGGKEWIYREPRPTYWRALTDNDRGCQLHFRSGIWLAADMYLRYKGMKMTRDGKEVLDFEAPQNNSLTDHEYCDELSITFHYETLTVPAAQTYITYTCYPCGSIRVDVHYEGQEGLPEFPVMGFRMVMPTKATGFTYEGLSGETYPDRMAGGIPGIYDVEGLPMTKYMVPQDCGMHMETKWVKIRRNTVLDNSAKNVKETAMKVEMVDKPFAFSALPYTCQEIENATHHEELPPARRTVLCVYGAVRGVGGIDSWRSDVEPPYRLDATKNIDFSFKISFE